MNRKIFKVLLSVVLVLGLMPSAAFAQTAPSSQSKTSSKEVRLSSSSKQEPLMKDEDSGTWGDCRWEWDKDYQSIRVYPGNAGSASDAPWYWSNFYDGEPNGGVKTISFVEEDGNKVVFPEDCEYLFSSNPQYEGDDTSTIESIDFSGADTSQVKIMDRMFYGCSSLSDFNFYGFETSSATSMYEMFKQCSSVTYLSPYTFDTSNVTTMGSMFEKCTNLSSLDITNFNTSNVTNMNSMFAECESLSSIDLTKINTSKVTYLTSMFYGCSSLQSVNLSKFNTENVSGMESMFYNCSSLKSLDFSTFNTPNLTDISFMFYGCSSLKSLDLTPFTTSKVVEMSNLFNGCSALTSLDLSSFDTTKLRLMANMFDDCTSLERVSLGSAISTFCELPSYDIDDHTDWYSLNVQEWFSASDINTSRLGIADTYTKYEPKSIDSVTISNITNKSYTGSQITQNPTLKDGSYTLKKDTDYTITYADNIEPGTAKITFTGMGRYTGSLTSEFTINPKEISKVTISGIVDAVYTGSAITQNLTLKDGSKTLQENTDYTVRYDNNINVGTATITITGMGKYGESTTKNFAITAFPQQGTWGNCDYTWDESTKTMTIKAGIVDDVKTAPWYCTKWPADNPNGGVKHIVFAEEGGNKVVLPADASKFFSKGTSDLPSTIESIDFTGVDTSSVTNMSDMFNGCSAIVSLNLATFNTENVADMSNMFEKCTSLSSLDLTSFDTQNVTLMVSMFNSCSALATLDVSNLKTEKVKNMASMFKSCSALTSLDLSGFNTPALLNIGSMFEDCSALESLDLSTLNTANLENMDSVFENCTSLARIKLGAQVTVLRGFPSYVVNDHADWYSENENVWFTSDEIESGRLGIADTYLKEQSVQSIENALVTGIEDKTFTGSEITQSPRITCGNAVLLENEDYTLDYENNINPGTATVIITGIGLYTGSTSKTFTINPKDISSTTVTGIENKTFTGSAITQSLRLTDGNAVLVENKDYTLTYENNVNPGTATIIIKGQGNYTGSMSKTFTITSATTPAKPVPVVQPTKTIKVKAGSNNPISLYFKAQSRDGGKLSYQWYSNNKPIKGATSPSYTIKDPSTLKPGNYSFYCMASEVVGGKTVSLKSEISHISITSPLSLTQMKAKGKNALTLAWNKTENADGYDIFFSRCNHGKVESKCKKIKTIKGQNNTSFTKTKLLAYTAYKCYIRPFKMVKGKKMYLSTSPQMHIYTAGGNSEYTNPKKISLNKSKVSVKAKKSYQLKAKITLTDPKKKIISSGHAPVVRYVSSDISVAKVSKTGKITGVAKGSCTIYAITQNGLQAACKVAVN